jgi:hypothetical protein
MSRLSTYVDTSTRVSNSGRGAVANGGNATFTDNSVMQDGTASAGTGAAAMANQFGSDAVVASANLASYVTGVTVTYEGPQGTSAGAAPNNSLSTGATAFQNFAGLQSLNMNTGVAASQNSAVNVSVSTGAINLGQ